MNGDDLDALVERLAAEARGGLSLEEIAQRHQSQHEAARAGVRDGWAAAADAAADDLLLACLTPSANGAMLGPWIELACPLGHRVGTVRAVADRRGFGLEPDGRLARRLQPADPGWDQAELPPGWQNIRLQRLDGRLRLACPAPRCDWSSQVGLRFLLRAYVTAAKSGQRRVPLAPPGGMR